jgi:hypothetical protein
MKNGNIFTANFAYMSKIKCFIFFSLILNNLVFADCTYRIDNPKLKLTQENMDLFIQEKGYVYDSRSSNILNIKFLHKSKPEFPYLNVPGVLDTVFMGMVKMRNDIELSLTKVDEISETAQTHFFHFGDTQQQVIGAFPKSYEKGINRALLKFQPCSDNSAAFSMGEGDF